MIRLKFPMLAGVFALGACASGEDVIIVDEHAGTRGELELSNPFALAPGAPTPVEPAVPPALLSLEEEEAEFQRRAHTPLADGERLKVERVLEQLDVSPGDVKFVGNYLLQTDVYTDSEELLEIPDEMIEKGRVLSRIFTSTNNTPGPVPPETGQLQVSPELHARLNGGTFQFFRPYLQHHTGIVVQTNDFMVVLYGMVRDNIANAATDCLDSGASGTIRVGTLADYNALTATQRARMPTIRVIRGPLQTACPGTNSVGGCSLGVRHSNILHPDGVTRSTMVIGPRIGLIDTVVTGLGGLSRRTASHELLHTMGLAHPSQTTADVNGDGQPDALVVPGTNAAANTISVLQDSCPSGTNCNVANPHHCCGSQANDPQQDDIDMVDTLYSPQAGFNCTYFNGFRNIAAN